MKESDTSYIFNGNTDVDLLEKLLGVRPEEKEATTIAGLVSELAGHIPKAGEVFEENGLRFEVLESTERRVDRVRVSLRDEPYPQQVEGLRWPFAPASSPSSVGPTQANRRC